ncbi:MAG: nicotinate (nicotinamide) nucleotide adenylyltransferase [Gammaproteobacteria bacterium]|nr:nicotinate (nicotinamide) nucleotide adenylyltransferase [Gammaproteobacteria bacterium]
MRTNLAPKSLLLFGGTFDPIHLGHLAIAQAVQQQFHFSSFLFLPCQLPVHKNQPSTTPEQRIHMLSLALDANPIENASICLDEIHRPTPSFTVDTLHHLRQKTDPNTPITLLIGLDAFLNFLTWHQPEIILQLSKLLVIQRPLANPTLPPSLQALLKQENNTITFFNAGLYEINSSTIRDHIQHKRPYRHWLPEAVGDYIEQEKLYRGSL